MISNGAQSVTPTTNQITNQNVMAIKGIALIGGISIHISEPP
jgi:hypothetical protein